jgi:hypothetical protein
VKYFQVILVIAALVLNQTTRPLANKSDFDPFSFPDSLRQELLSCPTKDRESVEEVFRQCDVYKKTLLNCSKSLLLEMVVQLEKDEKSQALALAACMAIRDKYPELAMDGALRFVLYDNPASGLFASESIKTELSKERPYDEFKRHFDVIKGVPASRTLSISIAAQLVPFKCLLEYYEKSDYPFAPSVEAALLSVLFRRCSESKLQPTEKMRQRIEEMAYLPGLPMETYFAFTSDRGAEYTRRLRALIERGTFEELWVRGTVLRRKNEIAERFRINELVLTPEKREFLNKYVYATKELGTSTSQPVPPSKP